MGCKPMCSSNNNEKECISVVHTVNSAKLPESVLRGLAVVLNCPNPEGGENESSEKYKENRLEYFYYNDQSNHFFIDKNIQSTEKVMLSRTSSMKSLIFENKKHVKGELVFKKSLSQRVEFEEG